MPFVVFDELLRITERLGEGNVFRGRLFEARLRERWISQN